MGEKGIVHTGSSGAQRQARRERRESWNPGVAKSLWGLEAAPGRAQVHPFPAGALAGSPREGALFEALKKIHIFFRAVLSLWKNCAQRAEGSLYFLPVPTVPLLITARMRVAHLLQLMN